MPVPAGAKRGPCNPRRSAPCLFPPARNSAPARSSAPSAQEAWARCIALGTPASGARSQSRPSHPVWATTSSCCGVSNGVADRAARRSARPRICGRRSSPNGQWIAYSATDSRRRSGVRATVRRRRANADFHGWRRRAALGADGREVFYRRRGQMMRVPIRDEPCARRRQAGVAVRRRLPQFRRRPAELRSDPERCPSPPTQRAMGRSGNPSCRELPCRRRRERHYCARATRGARSSSCSTCRSAASAPRSRTPPTVHRGTVLRRCGDRARARCPPRSRSRRQGFRRHAAVRGRSWQSTGRRLYAG